VTVLKGSTLSIPGKEMRKFSVSQKLINGVWWYTTRSSIPNVVGYALVIQTKTGLQLVTKVERERRTGHHYLRDVPIQFVVYWRPVVPSDVDMGPLHNIAQLMMEGADGLGSSTLVEAKTGTEAD
jgi:hypothetical protein